MRHVNRNGTAAVYACHRKSGLASFVGYDYTSPEGDVFGVRPIAVAGRYVAWTRTHSYHEVSVDVFALDGRTGKIVRQWRAPGGGGECQYYRPRSIVVRPNGSIAWLTLHYKCNGETPQFYDVYEVWKSESRSSKVVLDFGRDIDPDSLRLDGETVSWLKAGSPQAAGLH